MKVNTNLLIFLFVLDDGILQYLCFDAEEMHAQIQDTEKSNLRNRTLNKPSNNSTDVVNNTVVEKSFTPTLTLSDDTSVGVEDKAKMYTLSEQTETWIPDEPPRKVPLSIIITASGVAVGIVLFLCISFYFHNAQLNKKAERLSMTLFVAQQPRIEQEDVENSTSLKVPLVTTNLLPPQQNKCLPRNSSSPAGFPRNVSSQSINGFPRNSSCHNVNSFIQRENQSLNVRNFRDPDLFGQQRKSTISLGLPSRGSALSAYTDQEIANQSAKRKHSVFIL